MSADRFADFMRGFAAARLLMGRAGTNGCFVECVCLAASVVDGLLRTGLVLKHQLDSKTTDIPTDIIYQADDDKIVSERMIYRRTLDKGIISQDQFDRLEDLYRRRNKVIHRYIISEITTEQVLQIASEYEEAINEVKRQIQKLEDEQIESGVGMTRSGKQVPDEVRAKGDAQIHEMADEKHGNPYLAMKLKKSINDTNGS